MTTPTKQQTKQFEEFWLVCWRKKGKGAARKKYMLALKLESHKTILKAAEAYAESVRGKDRQFLPHPATWLFQERWDDEIDEPEFNPIEYLKQKREEEDDTAKD